LNKSTLIDKLSRKAQISEQDAKKVVDTFFDSISAALAKNHRTEIRGLCSFKVKKYKSYWGRNPQKGSPFLVRAKRLPVFKCGKELKERVDS
jgi:integration host factor subunit beta